ncbi:MAG TPA: nuclear transport factor 2 family protein [Chitinophagaceae bacterium]|nr:nuclear transport factor 2 family protein [Chitinophagaceae bacterium]
MKYFFPGVALIGFYACSSTKYNDGNGTDFNIDPVKAHITEMNKTYGQRFMTDDTAFYNARYCVDAQVFCPGTRSIISRDSIIGFFYAGGANKEAVIELPAGNIYGDENLVVEEGAYNFPDGKGGSVDKGKFIAHWKKEDGTWKLYREMWNSDKASN